MFGCTVLGLLMTFFTNSIKLQEIEVDGAGSDEVGEGGWRMTLDKRLVMASLLFVKFMSLIYLHITYLQESARISLNFIGVLSRLSWCVWYMYTYAYLSFARRFYVTMIASSLGTPFASVAWHRWWYFSWRKTRLSFTTYEFNEIYDTKCNVFLSRNQYSGAPRVVKESHQTNWLKDNSEGWNNK